MGAPYSRKILCKGWKEIMSMLIYTGTPGSGKSLHVVRDLWEKYNWGGTIITNIVLNLPKAMFAKTANYIHIDLWEMEPDDLIKISEEYYTTHNIKSFPDEDRLLLVLDECQLIFNARAWNDKSRVRWLRFFTQHRKYGYKIILVTQIAKMIDAQIRGLCEYEVIHRKSSNMGWKGMFMQIVTLSFPLYVAVTMWAAGGLKEKLDAKLFRGSRRIYRMYNTRQIHDRDL